MSKRNQYALIFFGIFYVSFGAYLTLFQERIIYQPYAQDFAVCPALRDARQETFRGTRLYVEDGERGVVILYHGNAGSACDRAFYAEAIRAAGYGYILPEYAGYSSDSVQPSHERIKQDVENVVAYIQARDVQNVRLIGESIGTGVAAYHASLAPPQALLLISPFTSLRDIARVKFWFYPTDLLVDNAFDTVTFLRNYTGLVTIIHGEADRIIPYRLGRSLFDTLSTDNKSLVAVEGAGHNDLLDFPATLTALQEFLER